MKLASATIFGWSLPLKKPLLLSGQTIRERPGLLLRLTDQTNRVGWGEIAPLPGFSVESLEEAAKDLKRLSQVLPRQEFSELSIFETTPSQPLAHLQLTPAVQFGLEMALLNLATPGAKETENAGVKVNGLIIELDRLATSRARELTSLGYKSIKIKIGRTEAKTETNLIRKISENLPNEVTLRLDGNQLFTLDQAVSFCHEIEGCKIEYIEEPLAEPAELTRLAQQTTIKFALDETIVAALASTDETSVLRLIEPNEIAAMVIKPTLIGGLHESLKLARLAIQASVAIVISSSYESSLGIACLAQLARMVEPNGVHGLDTLDTFESHLTKQVPSIESGELIVPSGSSLTPDLSLIEELTHE